LDVKTIFVGSDSLKIEPQLRIFLAYLMLRVKPRNPFDDR